MTARLTCWSNSRSGEKTWLHGSGWKILIELNTSKNLWQLLLQTQIPCVGQGELLRLGLAFFKNMTSNTEFCNSSASWENKKLKKGFHLFFLSTCAVQFVLSFLCWLWPFYFIKYACYRKCIWLYRDDTLEPVNWGYYELRHA